MNDFTAERYSFAQVAQRLDVSLPTVWRWALKGCKGVVLESFCIGGRRYTTGECVSQFIKATTAAASGAPPPQRKNRQARASIRRAHQDLDNDGI
jgi:hypothetical protein